MKKQLLILVGLLSVSILQAQIINVPGDQSTIQKGINAAHDGDTVLVAQGTYYENINFNGKAITLASHYLIDPDSSHIHMTIIDGWQSVNPDSASVVYFISGEDTTSILCGFTIRNGTGTYPDAWGTRSGGGINCVNSGAKIIHNRIINNEVSSQTTSVAGGGIYADTCSNRTLVFRHNIVEDNALYTYSYPNAALGAGVCIAMSNITQNNIFRNNYAEGWVRGAGLYISRSSGIVSNNLIENNHINVTFTNGWGAGLFLRSPIPGLIISQNKIINNTCSGGLNAAGGIGVLDRDDLGDYYIDRNTIIGNEAHYGGGVCVRGSTTAHITNNIIRENEAEYAGGGIYLTNVNLGVMEYNLITDRLHSTISNKHQSATSINQIANNTIIENTSEKVGGGIGNGLVDADFLAFNNIIYDNVALDYGDDIHTQNSSSTAILWFNDINLDLVFGQWTGGENIEGDPEYRDDSCHLSESSVCREAGIDWVVVDDHTYYAPLTDIDGEERPHGGFDIGADEWYPYVGITEPVLPNEYNLDLIIYPNPSKGKSYIQYTLSQAQYVLLKVFDLHGIEITTLVDKLQIAGKYSVQFDATDLPGGIYCVRLYVGEQVAFTRHQKPLPKASGKLLLVK